MLKNKRTAAYPAVLLAMLFVLRTGLLGFTVSGPDLKGADKGVARKICASLPYLLAMDNGQIENIFKALKGLDISVVGKQIFDYVDLDFGKGMKKEGSLQGRIIFTDQFGNLVTNISSDMVDFQFGDMLDIQKVRVLFHKSYGFCRKGEAVAMIGSHGFLEIAVNWGNAAHFFNKKPGDEIILRKIT